MVRKCLARELLGLTQTRLLDEDEEFVSTSRETASWCGAWVLGWWREALERSVKRLNEEAKFENRKLCRENEEEEEEEEEGKD